MNHRNWNEEFQRLLEKPTTTPEEAAERSQALKNVRSSPSQPFLRFFFFFFFLFMRE
jgi:hypothetical protein